MSKTEKTNSVILTTESLLLILEDRFKKNKQRHEKIDWEDVKTLLEKKKSKLEILLEMENTGGEPDVVDFRDDKLVFCDCSTESPSERRSLCYDDIALQSRKEFKPRGSAVGIARQMGIELLNEEEYRKLQEYGEFDIKTSSWIKTPSTIRKLGGSIFADRRYDTVFVYHNGAESYYASRGFRGLLEL